MRHFIPACRRANRSEYFGLIGADTINTLAVYVGSESERLPVNHKMHVVGQWNSTGV